jgi:hypothetical protein
MATQPPPGPPVKRSVTIAGHETSIALEPLFWTALEHAAVEERLPLNALIARIDAERLSGRRRRTWRPRSANGCSGGRWKDRAAIEFNHGLPEPALTGEKNPSLAGDLREHRCADRSFMARTPYQIPELSDSGLLMFDPLRNGNFRVLATDP